MYIDTHCHLNMSDFDADRTMVIGNAKKAGVKRFIVPGVDVGSSQSAIHIANNYAPSVLAAVGIHPYEAQHMQTIHAIDQMIEKNKKNIVAVGECGLDYHLYKNEPAISKKDNQKKLFSDHLTLASKHHLPVIIHIRDAFDDFWDVYDAQITPPPGVIHCFSGGAQEIRLASERGLYLGIDGNVTYSKSLAHTVSEIPLSMLLLETDAPYLTPVPHRGERNEPKQLPHSAKYIAQLLDISIESVASQTSANAQKLFGYSLLY